MAMTKAPAQWSLHWSCSSHDNDQVKKVPHNLSGVPFAAPANAQPALGLGWLGSLVDFSSHRFQASVRSDLAATAAAPWRSKREHVCLVQYLASVEGEQGMTRHPTDGIQHRSLVVSTFSLTPPLSNPVYSCA